MRLGVHVGISGGLRRALEEAERLGCEAIQIFSRSPRMWAFREFSAGEIREFRAGLKRLDIRPVAVHMLYLPNLAAAEANLYRRSVGALREELSRAGALGAEYVVIHPGRCADHSAGIRRIAAAMTEALASADNGVAILLENVAGGLTGIGGDFRELARLASEAERSAGRNRAEIRRRIGFCLDTAHAHAYGYDLSSAAGVRKTLEEWDREIGLKRLHMLHLNDSRVPCGSRVDRHEHIGRGTIGEAGFAALMRHPHLRNTAGVLETPKKPEGADQRNLRLLRRLARSG